jgi:asparagine synthase (glutamine-hydrolysing)
MCGIAGIYYYATSELVDVDLLRQMSQCIAHRGPDDHGIYLKDHIGLAHRRLSIIDLSPSGHQPLSNQDETIWITYNGECYNYKDFFPILKSKGYQFKSDSDTEVILHLYQEYGLDFLDKLDGMFAFAIWDSKLDRLILARDRIGIKPLYYYFDSKRLLFASELKALLADPTIPRELNYAALGDYFKYMSIPDPGCIFRGINKLLPGYFIIVENGFVRTQQYWDLADASPDKEINIKKASDDFIHHFDRAVASHMIADVPVGAFLSGGVDSSTVVAIASQKGKNQQPIETFSITFKGLGDFDESNFAINVAQKFGTNHHEFDLTPDLIRALPKIVWHADEPFAISSGFALYFLSELTSQYTKVVLSGDGGDEVFAGYPWRHWTEPRLPAKLVTPIISFFDFVGLHNLPGFQRVQKILLRSNLTPADVYEQTLWNFSPPSLSSLLTKDACETINETKQASAIHQYYEHWDNASSLSRKLYTDLKTTLVSEMLTKVDRMTMAFGLEARVPFLDHHLVEWAFHLPDLYKLHGVNGKYIVKKALENYLPRKILYRRKHGFNVPLRIWIRDQLKEMMQDVLSSRRFNDRGLFRPEVVQQILKNHFVEEKDYSDQIFSLIALELWFQQFVDNSLVEQQWQKS